MAQSIVKYQEEFLEKGINNLKPLTLREIAEDINMHESTVSRVTHNKYVCTPQGIFELKFFLAVDSVQLTETVVRPKVSEI